jgi:hypothetical protein
VKFFLRLTRDDEGENLRGSSDDWAEGAPEGGIGARNPGLTGPTVISTLKSGLIAFLQVILQNFPDILKKNAGEHT